jgi:hypothetical protein
MTNQDRNRQAAEAAKNAVPDQADEEIVDAADAEALVDGAEDAITEMVARERRRDQTYRTGGDDQDAGIDTEIDANAPKEQQLPLRKRSENQT